MKPEMQDKQRENLAPAIASLTGLSVKELNDGWRMFYGVPLNVFRPSAASTVPAHHLLVRNDSSVRNQDGRAAARNAGTAKTAVRAGIVALLLAGILLSGISGRAQTVDVQESLSEDSHPGTPILRIHPWRFLRGKADAAIDFLKDETGLILGVSDTTIYQIDPFISTPYHTTVNTLDVFGAWHLFESRTFGEGVLGFLFRDRTNVGPLTGNTLSNDVGLPVGNKQLGLIRVRALTVALLRVAS